MNSITMVIPSIPIRGQLLARAIHSVTAQTLQPDAYSIAVDNTKQGAGPTRTRALMAAQTEWVAFMDDDDELMPHHLATLHSVALATDADVVWPWFTVSGGTDPFPGSQGAQWDSANPHTFPMTTLVRRQLAQRCVFPEPIPGADNSGEDWAFWMQLDKLGAKFVHTPEITWVWHHDSGNTSGRPERW